MEGEWMATKVGDRVNVSGTGLGAAYRCDTTGYVRKVCERTAWVHVIALGRSVECPLWSLNPVRS